jgi:hypothetical protein
MTNVSRIEHSAPMISIYDGRSCIGFVLARGRRGYESFDASEYSFGVFETKNERSTRFK